MAAGLLLKALVFHRADGLVTSLVHSGSFLGKRKGADGGKSTLLSLSEEGFLPGSGSK